LRYLSLTAASRCLRVIRNLYDHADRYAQIELSLVSAAPRANAEHCRLLAHYRHGRIELACGVLRKHILDTGRSIADFLGRHKPGEGPDR
jgi:DNA-binding GntR family transcriptional regulator